MPEHTLRQNVDADHAITNARRLDPPQRNRHGWTQLPAAKGTEEEGLGLLTLENRRQSRYECGDESDELGIAGDRARMSFTI